MAQTRPGPHHGLTDVQLGTTPHLEETMEQQDDESLESLQACVENFVLPQEMIIEVEGEDAGSLDIMPQESTDFKIVTVDLTEEGQSMWNNAQRTPEKTVILEGHRDLWGDGDLQGCGCGLQRGGAGAAGRCPVEAVPRGDAGELQDAALSG